MCFFPFSKRKNSESLNTEENQLIGDGQVHEGCTDPSPAVPCSVCREQKLTVVVRGGA